MEPIEGFFPDLHLHDDPRQPEVKTGQFSKAQDDQWQAEEQRGPRDSRNNIQCGEKEDPSGEGMHTQGEDEIPDPYAVTGPSPVKTLEGLEGSCFVDPGKGVVLTC